MRMQNAARVGSLDHPPSLLSEPSYQLQGGENNSQSKRGMSICLQIKARWADPLSSASAQLRARWGFLPLASHHVFWFLLNELHTSKMSSLPRTPLSLVFF